MINRIKPVFKCADAYKETFKYSRCLLTISVGQEVHEGDKFAATIDLVNASFDSCIMLIDDSLQRHSMALNTEKDADYFYEISLKEGDLWLERNEQYYRNLTILEKTIRWDTWLKHPNYNQQQNKIKLLLDDNPTYKFAFEETVKEFLRRYCQRMDSTKLSLERARLLCFDYLIEECTALCLWSELNCHFEVYPSRRNLAMSETHKHFVLPKYLNLLHAVSIKFKNRKQLQPQRFELLQDEAEEVVA